MPSITFDGQTFTLDGHRLWIVSGTIPFHRIPPELWQSRIWAAKQAGLNCIETPVVWSLHEPRPGTLKFDDALDLTRFIRLIGDMGLRCILRVGPCVGDGEDAGGLPSWVLRASAGVPRSGATDFLQPASRFLAALCAKVRDLQATASRKGSGPIIAVQNEHQWNCGSEAQRLAYLQELNRFLRESGINVPILAANNLYAAAEGEPEVWVGSDHLYAHMRQLRAVKPDQPRYVAHLPSGAPAVWGEDVADAIDPRAYMRRLAEVVAAGAQFNAAPFCGGTRFGFSSGRFDDASGSYARTSAAPDAPLGEDGSRGPLYSPLRKIASFASSFSRVLSALDPAYQPAILSLEQPAGAPRPARSKAGQREQSGSLSIIETRGSQGGVIFVFAPPESSAGRTRASLLLPEGWTLPFELDRDPVAWALFKVHLFDRATLDYCNLSPVMLVGKVLVLYGPSAAPCLFSINDSASEVIVPEGMEPAVIEHEGVTLVVCNEESVESVCADGHSVFIGASALEHNGTPIPHPKVKRITRLQSHAGAPPATATTKRTIKATLGPWHASDLSGLISGSSDRYASIDGPAPIDALGAPHGYAWMRLKFKSATRSAHTAFLEAADRVHLFHNDQHIAVVGEGPGAEHPVTKLKLKDGEQTITALIDNLGRRCEGNALGEHKGIFGQVWEVAALRPPAPKIVSARTFEPLQWRAPIFGLEQSDTTDARRLTWKLQHKKKTPIFLRMPGSNDPAIVLLNDEPIGVLPHGGTHTIVLPHERFTKGSAIVQIAALGDALGLFARIKQSAEWFEAVAPLSPKVSWAFAKWEPPAASRFKPVESTRAFASWKGTPVWWRTALTIEGSGAPLIWRAKGLSKGQLFLNGRNLCRYWIATHAGKPVPGQIDYYLPEPWLKQGVNELMIFDEHGFAPTATEVTTSH